MALVLKDRVKETTATTGTGTLTLAGAAAGFQSFSVIGDGNTTYYTITDGTDWEVGVGTYTASGTTLSRDTVVSSSNSGSVVNWGTGSKDVFVTVPSVTVPPVAAATTAWVTFNGIGTVAVTDGYNVSSVTDYGTGQYGVTFTTAMDNANYAISGFVYDSGGGTGNKVWVVLSGGSSNAPSTTDCIVWTKSDDNGTQDYTRISVMFVGGMTV